MIFKSITKMISMVLCLSILTACSNEKEDIFQYDEPKNVYNVEFDGSEHLRAAPDMIITTEEFDGVYEFDYKGKEWDYYSRRDEFGKYYLGNSYDSNKWKINEELLSNGDKCYMANYDPEHFSGEFFVSSDGVFSYQEEGTAETFPLTIDGFERIDNDDKKYKLSDRSFITYSEAVSAAKELIKGYDHVMGNEGSDVSGVYYNAGAKAIKIDFVQKIHGLKISKIKTIMDLNYTEYDDLSIHTSNDFMMKEAYVFSSQKNGIKIYVFTADLDITDTAKHDKIITLQSVLNSIDHNAADKLVYEVISAELKYLPSAIEVKQENGDITLDELHGFPVWEIILYNTTENREYAYICNALNGERSLIKLN